MEISSTHLRYLYAIYEIFKTSPGVRSSIVAKRMNVSRPSVAKMLKVLMDKNLIVKEKYGKIRLTCNGLFIVRSFDRKVCIIESRLKYLGLKLTYTELHEAACAVALVLYSKKL